MRPHGPPVAPSMLLVAHHAVYKGSSSGPQCFSCWPPRHDKSLLEDLIQQICSHTTNLPYIISHHAILLSCCIAQNISGKFNLAIAAGLPNPNILPMGILLTSYHIIHCDCSTWPRPRQDHSSTICQSKIHQSSKNWENDESAKYYSRHYFRPYGTGIYTLIVDFNNTINCTAFKQQQCMALFQSSATLWV